MIGSPAIIAASYGRGRVILFSPHPDIAPGLESWLIRAVRACSNNRVRRELGLPGLPTHWRP